MELEIYNDIEHNRFVAQTEHGEATLKYKRADADTLDFTSTFVPEEARKGGLGERLVLHALDWAAENDFQVLPTCPFVRHVLDEHPERVAVLAV
ncbi:MAG TPA: GNAT family N-acetyltransferase [Gemmatimonadota bacterium]|nr:GNAT family N-acetyltransferase [Gemmatimonadota bacterium]